MCNIYFYKGPWTEDVFLDFQFRRPIHDRRKLQLPNQPDITAQPVSRKRKIKNPPIPKFVPKPGDFNDLLLIGFDKTHLEDRNHLDRMVHFFLYDYRFERVWKNPESDIEKLSRYRAVLSPDFSMYLEMAPVMQLYNVFRNRWCGAYWASKGMRVIPTVNWGDESTFDFCFEGIEKGSAVAVSTYMASEHGNHQDQKEWFLAGYNEMLRQIEPEKIICYNTPFPEMRGDIVFVDYERSSWRYMNYERSYKADDLESYKIAGQPKVFCDTITPFLDVPLYKGGGSAYGGAWKPAKSDDERYIGIPGEIKPTDSTGKHGGYHRETKIGDDGRAIIERHYTDHFRPDKHTDPHDHIIDWSEGFPMPQRGINYPDGAPEFKQFGGLNKMSTAMRSNTLEENRFKSISDFKWCIDHGGEVEIEWRGRSYGIFSQLCRTPDSPLQKMISEIAIDDPASTEKWCDTADEVLEYIVGDDRLRDVITQVTVWTRTI